MGFLAVPSPAAGGTHSPGVSVAYPWLGMINDFQKLLVMLGGAENHFLLLTITALIREFHLVPGDFSKAS